MIVSTEEIVNMYCNMNSLNEAQEQALSKLLQPVFDDSINERIFQCAHCGTEGQELRVCTLTYFDDDEDLYCKHCVARGEP